MVEENKTLWDSLSPDLADLPPKLVFSVNQPVEVEFPSDFDKPMEFDSENGKYCVFNVKHKGEDVRITTSAWTLLAGLKKLSPLAGKKITICKAMENGKQRFVVEELK